MNARSEFRASNEAMQVAISTARMASSNRNVIPMKLHFASSPLFFEKEKQSYISGQSLILILSL
jgi:hypothetical protein